MANKNPPELTWQTMSADERDTFSIICKQPGISGPALGVKLARKVSQPTISRRLDKMAPVLRREGSARSTAYFVKDPLIYLGRQVESGREVGYNLRWLTAFKPNRDTFFHATEIGRAHV